MYVLRVQWQFDDYIFLKKVLKTMKVNVNDHTLLTGVEHTGKRKKMSLFLNQEAKKSLEIHSLKHQMNIFNPFLL